MSSRGVLRLLVVAIATIFLPQVLASAHTTVVKTTPTYQSTLDLFPEKISIEFTDELMIIGDKEINTISINNPNNQVVAISSIEVAGSTLTAKPAAQEFPKGTYTVSYRVVSADGHPVSGSYELYLKEASEKIAEVAPINTATSHTGFFHIHQTHLIQAGAVAILIILWWGYRRFNQHLER